MPHPGQTWRTDGGPCGNEDGIAKAKHGGCQDFTVGEFVEI